MHTAPTAPDTLVLSGRHCVLPAADPARGRSRRHEPAPTHDLRAAVVTWIVGVAQHRPHLARPHLTH